ncbi:MAG: putative transposase [Candidatus Binatia bacterium]|jgi:putative transposase
MENERAGNPFNEPGRKKPSPGVHIYSGHPTFVFLTVRTLKSSDWLVNAVAHEFIHETWLGSKAWLVSDYLLMPDHLHLFCAPGEQAAEIGIEDWIQFWKRNFRLRHGNADWKFQSRGWHHRLRNEESYSEKWRYMMENPVRRGLVKVADEWPFRGRVFELRW